MGDDLNRTTQIIATAFLTNNRIVDLAGRKVGFFGQVGGGVALIMAQVQIGLSTIISDKNLTVLKRAHGSRINVDIGVQLLHGNF